MVVAMAQELIRVNIQRPVPRELVPRRENGEGDVRIIQYPTLDREVSGVVGIIRTLVDGGVPPGDILVLAQRGVIGTPIGAAASRAQRCISFRNAVSHASDEEVMIAAT
jgi:DNA helicase-2/ATP-dependent DNA helicase PcrA